MNRSSEVNAASERRFMLAMRLALESIRAYPFLTKNS